MESTSVSVSTLLWTGVIGVILLVLRQTVLAVFSAKNQIVSANAQDSVFNRLQAEITRLEKIINKQNERIEELSKRITELSLTEAEDAADIAILTIVLEEIRNEMGLSHKWPIIHETLTRMRMRRRSKHAAQGVLHGEIETNEPH